MHQNFNIKYMFNILHVYIIIQFIQTYLLIKYKNFLFSKKFSFNLLKFISSFSDFNKSMKLRSKFQGFIKKIHLILKVNKGRIEMESSIFITLFYYVYVFTISQDTIEIYLSSLLLLTGVLIKLIKITNYWVNNNQLKKDFPIFYSIIKYILFALLIIISLVLIIIGQKLLIMVITYLKKLFLNMNIKSKLKDLKLSLDYKWVKNNGNKPNKPEGTFFIDLNNKKENKKRASYLKDKILDAQKKNLNKDFTNTTLKQESFSQKRNWTRSINIEDNPKFTISEQINNVKSEFKAYDNQEKKFKKIVVDINKEKEEFFPNESKSLFNEYVSVIKVLKKNLKLVEKTLSKNKN